MDLYRSYWISYTSKWGNLWIVHHFGAKCWPQTAGIVLNIKKDHGCYTSPFLGSLHFALGSQKDVGRILVKKLPQRNHGYFLLGSGGVWNWCPVWKLREVVPSEAPKTTKLVPVARGGWRVRAMVKLHGKFWGVGTAQWEFQDPTDGGTLVPDKAQICGDIPLHRPQK